MTANIKNQTVTLKNGILNLLTRDLQDQLAFATEDDQQLMLHIDYLFVDHLRELITFLKTPQGSDCLTDASPAEPEVLEARMITMLHNKDFRDLGLLEPDQLASCVTNAVTVASGTSAAR